MKFKILLAATVAALLALSSCKKDDTITPNSTTPSKRLKKITKTEAGISTVYNLTYNAANKLLSYKNATNTEYVVFSYDAAGNLTGIEQQEDEFKNVYTYTYQNNKPVSGIFKSWHLVSGQPNELVEDDRLTYTVTNNQVTKIKLEMLQSSDVSDLQLTYTGNNLTRVVSEGGPVDYTAIFSFGTQKPVFPKVSDYVLDQAGFSLQFVCNNELVSASFDFPGTVFDININTQYTFDNAGYALTSNDGSTQVVFEYE